MDLNLEAERVKVYLNKASEMLRDVKTKSVTEVTITMQIEVAKMIQLERHLELKSNPDLNLQ